MASLTDWSNPNFLKSANVPDDLSVPLMDAGVGYMNRLVQVMVDRMADRLCTLGALDRRDTGARTDYSVTGDFTSSTLGSKVMGYLRRSGADTRDVDALPGIISGRNYFVHEYPGVQSRSNRVDPRDFIRLKELILAVRESGNRLTGALNNTRRAPGDKESPDYKKMVKVIESAVPRNGKTVTLENLSHAVQREFPGTPVSAVLGVKLQRFLEDSRRYEVTGNGNDARVSRRE